MTTKDIIFEYLDANKSTYEYSILTLEENNFNKQTSFFLHTEVFIHGDYTRVMTLMFLYIDSKLIVRRGEISNVFEHNMEWISNPRSKALMLNEWLDSAYKQFIYAD